MAKPKWTSGDLLPFSSKPALWALLWFNSLELEDEDNEDEDPKLLAWATKLLKPDAKFARAVQKKQLAFDFGNGWGWRIRIDQGHHHVLVTPEGTELALGRDDGHPVRPILRWEELDAMRSSLRARKGNATDDALLVLALHSVTEGGISKSNFTDGIKARQAALVSLLALPKENAHYLALKLAGLGDVEWSRDRLRGFVNDGADSARNPKSAAGKLFAKANGFETLNRFFSAVGLR